MERDPETLQGDYHEACQESYHLKIQHKVKKILQDYDTSRKHYKKWLDFKEGLERFELKEDT